MAKKKEEPIMDMWSWNTTQSSGFGLGWFLLLLGGFFLAKDMGFIQIEVSIWPIVLILIGAWMIGRRR